MCIDTSHKDTSHKDTSHMYDFVYTSVKKNPYRDGALPPNSTLLLNHSVLPFENISQKDAQPLDRAPLVW